MRILGIGPCPAEDKADADLINAGEQTVTILAAMRVFDCESAELASQLLRDICARQCISPGQMTLHSDNRRSHERRDHAGHDAAFGCGPHAQPTGCKQ